jgi:hypothetical protein
MAAQGIDRLGPLPHQKIPSSEYNCIGLGGFALHRYKAHVGLCAASQIVSASVASFFCRFTNGFT